MYIVAIAWMFVVVCMAAAEATTSLFGALGTLLGYGVLPLGLVLWLLGTPQRRRNRRGGPARPSGASFTRGGEASRDRDADGQ